MRTDQRGDAVTALQEQRTAMVLAWLIGPQAITMAATVAEIAEACGIPDHGVRRALSDLHVAGQADRTGGHSSTGAECWVATAKGKEAAEARQ